MICDINEAYSGRDETGDNPVKILGERKLENVRCRGGGEVSAVKGEGRVM